MSSIKKDQPKAYWRSLAEWSDDEDFTAKLANEFPQSPIDGPGTFGRRRFLQLMGASVALASGAACRWEKKKILAFTRRPAGHVPGVPKHFATSMELGGVAQGLHVVSYDGRPIKIEGNPKHPMSRGASTAFAQASVLELYDPDRSQTLVVQGHDHLGEPTWDDFATWLKPVRQQALAQRGQGMVVLSEKSSSPSLLRLADAWRTAHPQGQWLTWEPLASDGERFGTAEAFGTELRAINKLREARVVVSIDADLFSEHPASLAQSQDFAEARRPEGDWMTRLWSIESRHSATGGAADHRLPLRAQQMTPFLLAVMREVAAAGSQSGAQDLSALRELKNDGFLAEAGTQKFVRALAQDLLAHRGQSVLVAGAGQPKQVHQLVHQLNALLGNVGHTVCYVAHPEAGQPSQHEAIAKLAEQMRAGKVHTLVMLGGNPVFDAPVDVQFAEALSHVDKSVHLSLFRDETSAKATWHLPRSHYLESWGDSRSYDGTVSLAQPLLEPLYKTKSAIEVVALLLGDTLADDAIAKQTFASLASLAGADADAQNIAYRQAVQAGFVANSAWAEVAPARRALKVGQLDADAFASQLPNGNLELSFWTDPHVYDGRFANNGWLQELPDFMSKLTWDNAAFFAPQTAKDLGVRHETLVTLEIGGRSLTMAAYVMPGQAPGSIAVHMGYGRTDAGHVAGLQHGGVDSAGFNTYGLRTASGQNFAKGLKVVATGKTFALAITQDHHALDAVAQKGRDQRVPEIVREADWDAYKADPSFAKEMVEHPPLKSLWKEFSYEGHRWGMAIDLNSCTGCNACVIACQAENNIPIVGKEDVIKGRSMHWLRLDRYFSGDPASPKMVSQPMACQQCELAPCESVCPVAATVHSSEGLNDMVYNRCVGTRYCSNNCPYKVRRFNFFNYHKTLEHSENQVTKMVYNPEVTVRARGVMEKCTYCVQRIQNHKIVARNERRALRDGEITPACAQSCASDAIVFGDLNDSASRVAKAHSSPRAYSVLGELNTKPRTQYLARVRNPHKALAVATPSKHKAEGHAAKPDASHAPQEG